MSETENFSPAEPLPPPMAAPPPVPQKPRPPVWPAVFALGFLVLAGGEAYLWVLNKQGAADATELAVLQTQVADLQNLAVRAEPAPDSITGQADFSVKLATLAAQLNAVQAQMSADHGTLSTMQANSADLTQLTARMTLLNQLENARMALEAGQPLGNISGAPPALAQFAATPPPTLAQLRLSFPAAARAAEAASIAGDAHASYGSRVLARLENFITVSEGTHVLLGAPAAGVITQAQTLLDAGDLAGAVANLQSLSAPAQQALSGWLAQANALLAAQSALRTMAGQV